MPYAFDCHILHHIFYLPIVNRQGRVTDLES